jgi:AraC family transcriptional regulator
MARGDPNLSVGEFFGRTLRRGRASSLTVSELRFEPGARAPEHSHQRPIFNFVLEGGYTEYWNGRSMECDPHLLLFHPSGLSHSERFGPEGARCLTIEFDVAWLERLEGVESRALRSNLGLPAGPWAWLRSRIRGELAGEDDLTSLALEGYLLLLIAGASRAENTPRPGRPSVAVERARELLHAGYASSMRISDIAAEAGITPSYLARAFQSHYGCTPAEYVRWLRVEHACRYLRDSDLPIARLAREAGFSDQSHLNRVFKRYTGQTPGDFRRQELG